MGRRTILALGALVASGCDADGEVLAIVDAGASDATPDLGRAVTLDDAVIVRSEFPERLACGGVATATVIVRNTGTTTWTRAGDYRLGPVRDGDPLRPDGAHVPLLDGESIPPSATRVFAVPLTGPSTAAAYTTSWRMVRGASGWFGSPATALVQGTCAVLDAGAPDVPAAQPDVPRPDVPVIAPDVPRTAPVIDLSMAAVLNSPADVPSWPATATITRLELSRTGVRIDFTKRDGPDSWPDVPFITPGENLQYTLWIVLNVDGRWYTSGCLQYWRGLDRMGGPPSEYAMNWYYDANRWRPMTGHQPAVGEYVGFFVTAGNARNVTDHSGSVVRERSNVVVVPFPADDGATFTY